MQMEHAIVLTQPASNANLLSKRLDVIAKDEMHARSRGRRTDPSLCLQAGKPSRGAACHTTR